MFLGSGLEGLSEEIGTDLDRPSLTDGRRADEKDVEVGIDASSLRTNPDLAFKGCRNCDDTGPKPVWVLGVDRFGVLKKAIDPGR